MSRLRNFIDRALGRKPKWQSLKGDGHYHGCWWPGDKATPLRNGTWFSPETGAEAFDTPRKGMILTVTATVMINGFHGLVFLEFDSSWSASGFRKLVSDEAEGELADWHLILDGIKPKVGA